MKFASAVTVLACAFSAVHAGQNPDCQVKDVDGYFNCKATFFVNGSGSDLLWCSSKSDCEKVFPEAPAFPIPTPTQAPVAIASLEAFDSAATIATTVNTAALLLVAAAVLY